MPTFLFDKIIFGPVKSRRLGVSLGINLLPVTAKVCNFNCIYCECGLNTKGNHNTTLPLRKDVYTALETKLLEMLQNNQVPDVITFAGNGEPTLHPEFPGIIDDTIALRNRYVKAASISALSNATMLHKPMVAEALKKVDQNILKLDSGLASTIEKLNQPVGNYNLQQVVEQLKQFNGNVIIQTMFLRGEINTIPVDNTTEDDIASWEKALIEINPRKVMIYTIDRATPHPGLQKISLQELQAIADRIKRLGIDIHTFA